MSEPLLCPRCASTHALTERFCPLCGMPLVYSSPAPPITDQQERARKVSKQYTEGELVRVAGADNQTEAEFLQGLLLEEGVPSLLRRRAGFDVPDFMAAGPRDVMVPASGAEAAREVLMELRGDDAQPLPTPGATRPLRLMAGLMAGLTIGAVLLTLATHIFG
ncbi:MAG: hypothetical protein NVSMB51_14560 [Solirubrobacteraceae bacterium]